MYFPWYDDMSLGELLIGRFHRILNMLLKEQFSQKYK